MIATNSSLKIVKLIKVVNIYICGFTFVDKERTSGSTGATGADTGVAEPTGATGSTGGKATGLAGAVEGADSGQQ